MGKPFLTLPAAPVKVAVQNLLRKRGVHIACVVLCVKRVRKCFLPCVVIHTKGSYSVSPSIRFVVKEGESISVVTAVYVYTVRVI